MNTLTKHAGVGNMHTAPSRQQPQQQEDESLLKKHKGKFIGGALAAGAGVAAHKMGATDKIKGMLSKSDDGPKPSMLKPNDGKGDKTPKLKGLDRLNSDGAKGERSHLPTMRRSQKAIAERDYMRGGKLLQGVTRGHTKPEQKTFDDASSYDEMMGALKDTDVSGWDKDAALDLLGLYKAAGLKDLLDKGKDAVGDATKAVGDKLKKGKRHIELRGGAKPSKDEWMGMSDALKQVNKHNRQNR